MIFFSLTLNNSLDNDACKTFRERDIESTALVDVWYEIISSKTPMANVMSCGENYSWNNSGYAHSDITEKIRSRGDRDPTTTGIWSKMPTKLSIFLWRLR